VAAPRPAAISPGSRSTLPPTNNAAGSPLRSTSAMAATVSVDTAWRGADGRGATGSPASSHETSAGRMSVATWPGARIAAAMASAASALISAGSADVRTQPDGLRATVSMSESSGASYCRW
jgi:hypothetical protein